MTRSEFIQFIVNTWNLDGSLVAFNYREKRLALIELGRYKVINPKKYKIEIPASLRNYVKRCIPASWFKEVETKYFGE